MYTRAGSCYWNTIISAMLKDNSVGKVEESQRGMQPSLCGSATALTPSIITELWSILTIILTRGLSPFVITQREEDRWLWLRREEGRIFVLKWGDLKRLMWPRCYAICVFKKTYEHPAILTFILTKTPEGFQKCQKSNSLLRFLTLLAHSPLYSLVLLFEYVNI